MRTTNCVNDRICRITQQELGETHWQEKVWWYFKNTLKHQHNKSFWMKKVVCFILFIMYWYGGTHIFQTSRNHFQIWGTRSVTRSGFNTEDLKFWSNLGTCYLVFFTWCTYTDIEFACTGINAIFMVKISGATVQNLVSQTTRNLHQYTLIYEF